MAGKITTKKVDKARPRSARVSVSYRPKSKKTAIGASEFAKYIENFQYVDVAQGESDTVSITLCNAGLEWSGKWLPKKGDTLYAKITSENWRKDGKKDTVDCGRFCCDDRNYSFPNSATAVINGVSCPENHAFRATLRNKTWENITIYEIAKTMAARYWMELKYFAGEIRIEKAEQSDADDCSFLNSLCGNYGLYVKIYSGRIVIYDVWEFERKAAVQEIEYKEILDGDYNSTLTGTYTGAKISYSVKEGKETKEKSFVIGTQDRLLAVSEKADNYSDAVLKAWAKLRAENRKAETLKITVAAAGRPLWAATSIKLKHAGWMSGKWFIDKATHTVSATDGYTISLELHRFQK